MGFTNEKISDTVLAYKRINLLLIKMLLIINHHITCRFLKRHFLYQ